MNTQINLEWLPSEVLCLVPGGLGKGALMHSSYARSMQRRMPTIESFSKGNNQTALPFQCGRLAGTTPTDAPRPTGSPLPTLWGAPVCHHWRCRSSRMVSATLIRLITGHAIIGSYTARFHPHKPTHYPECRANPQMVGHVSSPLTQCRTPSHLLSPPLWPISTIQPICPLLIRLPHT